MSLHVPHGVMGKNTEQANGKFVAKLERISVSSVCTKEDAIEKKIMNYHSSSTSSHHRPFALSSPTLITRTRSLFHDRADISAYFELSWTFSDA